MKFSGRLLGPLAIAGASFLLIFTSFSYEAEQTGTVPATQTLPAPLFDGDPQASKVSPQGGLRKAAPPL